MIEHNIKPSRILTNPTLTGIKIQQFKAKVVIEKQRKFTLINYDPLKICDKSIKQQHPLSLTKSKTIFTNSDINELVKHQLQRTMRIIPNQNKTLNLIPVENKIKVIEITSYQDSLAISKKGLICGKPSTTLDKKVALSVFIKNQSKAKTNRQNITIKTEFPLLEDTFKVLKSFIAKRDLFQYGKFGTF